MQILFKNRIAYLCAKRKLLCLDVGSNLPVHTLAVQRQLTQLHIIVCSLTPKSVESLPCRHGFTCFPVKMLMYILVSCGLGFRKWKVSGPWRDPAKGTGLMIW
jgi:hypothetical protein